MNEFSYAGGEEPKEGDICRCDDSHLREEGHMGFETGKNKVTLSAGTFNKVRVIMIYPERTGECLVQILDTNSTLSNGLKNFEKELPLKLLTLIERSNDKYKALTTNEG